MDSPVAEQLDDTRNEIVVSVNPKAGMRSGRPTVDRFVELLTQRGYVVEVETEIDRLAERAAERLAAGRLRAVVSAGGDGTAGLIVNRTPPGTPIAILPLGTENLLAKYLGLRNDLDAICRVIDDGFLARLDAGRAGDRVFLLMLGCGFDAEVVRRLHAARTGNIHHLSYLKPILDSIRNYDYPELSITAASADAADATVAVSSHSMAAKWVFVVNLPRYAGGLSFVPDASGCDGLLDVCTFREGSLWNGLMYLGGVILGQHRQWEDCVTYQTKRLRIESAGQVPYQLDGDPGGYLPVDVELLPGRLTILAPRAWFAA
jgi:diacylglycerol kinase (ATP)